MESSTFDMRLKHDASMIISGPSGSGKTTFIRKLLNVKDYIFDTPLKKVYWFYGIAQPELHSQLRSMGVLLEEGLPPNFNFIPPYSIVILDDLGGEMKSNKGVTQLFTRVAHHKHSFIIVVTQNLFEKGSEIRTQHLNAQYLVLFKNPRDSLQIRILGSQMYPHKKNFLTAVFADATSKSYGYLFIDNHQTREDNLRLRTDIFPDELPMKVYLPKS